MGRTPVVYAFMLAGLVGCMTHGSYTRVKTAPAKLYPCDLKFFKADSEVGRRFEPVCSISQTPGHGILWDTPGQTEHHRDDAMRRVRQIACSCGADAVIVPMDTSERSTIDALAIRYTD